MTLRLVRPVPLLVAVAALAAGCGGNAGSATPGRTALADSPPSDPARAALKAILVDVPGADGVRYDAHDDAGHGMDTAKIIGDPAGGYLAVYHTIIDGTFRVLLATSNDLLDWSFVRQLAGDDGPASQPTLKATGDGGFVLAWEQEPGNHVRLAYFASRADLFAGAPTQTADAPMVFSPCANGTPNLYSASRTRVDFGFHYFSNCDVDRQARATTDWSSFDAHPQPQLDNALLYWGATANIGGRDGDLSFDGFRFDIIEGQSIKHDFGSWRSFVYDPQTGNAEPLDIRTHGGSHSFANPKFTRVTVDGQPAIVVTIFVPSEGAAPGEAGELIYFKKL
jgi:hypothetical protein